MGEVVHLSGQRVTCDLHLTPIAPRRWALINSVSDLVVGEIHVGCTAQGAVAAEAYRASLSDSTSLIQCGPATQGPAAFAAALRLLLRSIDYPANVSGNLMK